MRRVRSRLGHAVVAALLLGGLVVPAVSGPASATAPDRASQTAVPKQGTGSFEKRLVQELRRSGLEVSVGYPALYTQADCGYSYPALHNCYGNNPSAPYVIPVVKPWPQEYVDPAMQNAYGRTRPGYSSTYRLDPREAIVFFGTMPPPARYMGLQTWVATTGWVSEESPWDEAAYDQFAARAGALTQYLFGTVPGNQSRVQSLSSIDNNINNVVMQNQSGRPWDQIRYFVVTPDQAMDDVVRGALTALGVDSGAIFTEGIPQAFQGAPVGPLGLDATAAEFTTFLRYSDADDQRAADAWRANLPLSVLRVREQPSSPRPAVPYDPVLAEARTAVDEVGDADLTAGLATLVDAVVARAGSDPWTLGLEREEQMIDLLNELGQFGPDCRAIGMNCLGDNQDASYFLVKPVPLDTGKVYAIVSTLATETGNGTYVGLSVNDASLLKGVANLSDGDLLGSASSYAAEVPDAQKFFVHFFSRDCDAIRGLADGACTTITKGMVPVAGDDRAPGDPELHGMFSVAVRTYVKPGSERGPDPTLQLRPVVLTFAQQ